MRLEELFEDIGADLNIVLARFGGNRALLERFIKKFPGDNNYDSLEKAVKGASYIEVEQTAHTLKGVSANLGFSDFSDSCASIVVAVRQEKFDLIDPLLEEMRGKYKLIVDSIKQLD